MDNFDTNASVPLSTVEVDNFLKKDNMKCILYDELKDKPIEYLFQNEAQYCIILYTSDVSHVGHFVCVGNLGKKEDGRWLIEYFEPTGTSPLPDQTNRKINGGKDRKNRKYLTKMFKNCDVIVNTYKLQDSASNNCGKWCIARCMSYPCDIDTFAKIFQKNKSLSSDEIVNSLIRINR